ncbi:hypothetical protein [Allgaiera indica]|uniref:hypothetical protein n=1 Tax=Allgaiera indica TaxID=765699 RepID=UPI0013620C9B|nr:hypothetical protein [Allgaiera indica]
MRKLISGRRGGPRRQATDSTRNGRQLGIPDRLMRHLGIARAGNAMPGHFSANLLHRGLGVNLGKDTIAVVRKRRAGTGVDGIDTRAKDRSRDRICH